jgi:DHA2 family methylenomycin A resistance protein-like MFS transporter
MVIETETETYTPTSNDAAHREAAGVTLALTCTAAFMAALDVTIVNVALPSIQASLGGTIAGLQWIGAGYTLTFACLLLAGGTLSDCHGPRAMFVTGLAIFSLGSLVCGLSPGMLMLNLARVVQGGGAALIVPATLALLREAHPDRHARARAIAIYAASGGIAQVSGPVLGGALVATLGWPAIFFVNVPIGIVVLLVTLSHIPSSSIRKQRSLDLPGQCAAMLWLLSLAAALIQGGQSGWMSVPVLACFGVSVVALAVFVALERRATQPMVPINDLDHFRTAALLAVAVILGFAYFGLFFVLAIFFQDGWGATPIIAGLAFLPMTIGVTTANLAIGPRVGRIGTRIPMMIGHALCAAGYLALSRIDGGTDYASIGILFAMIGVGGGLIVPAMTAAMFDAVQPERSGIASGMLNAGRQMGSVIGIALFGSLVARSGLIVGLHKALIVAGAVMTFGILLSGIRPKLHPQRGYRHDDRR